MKHSNGRLTQAQTYAEAYKNFDLERAMPSSVQVPHGNFNAAIHCCDQHCGSNRTALHWMAEDGRNESYTFEQLRDASERFAQVLRAEGITTGDRVAGLLPRVPELLITVLGAWRAGAIYQPLFTAFGPKAIEHRVRTSAAKVIVTNSNNRHKLEGLDVAAKIITVGSPGTAVPTPDLDFHAAIRSCTTGFDTVVRSAEDPFLIMFTSGTTGLAKPLLVPLKAITAFVGYMRDAVDLQPSDEYWNIADPGWAYGLYYGITGPLAMGHATHLYDGPFTVESAVRVIRERAITNLAGAPTAYRHIMATGPEAVRAIKGKLRAVSSAGEPLNPEVIRWFDEHLATTIHDHYGQTEIGMVVCNHHGLSHPVHLGAAGFSVPGHRMIVLDAQGNELPPGASGNLALDRHHSPLFWFNGYEGMATPALGDRYYLTGDTAQLNEDGSISFIGRDDDVITSAGYRIGPFDVESALLEHPAVAETAVIGKPDPERTEIVKAFVVLRPGYAATPELSETLRRQVRDRLSAHAYPREIEFVERLPKTPSGKIQRIILRNEERARVQGAHRDS